MNLRRIGYTTDRQLIVAACSHILTGQAGHGEAVTRFQLPLPLPKEPPTGGSPVSLTAETGEVQTQPYMVMNPEHGHRVRLHRIETPEAVFYFDSMRREAFVAYPSPEAEVCRETAEIEPVVDPEQIILAAISDAAKALQAEWKLEAPWVIRECVCWSKPGCEICDGESVYLFNPETETSLSFVMADAMDRHG